MQTGAITGYIDVAQVTLYAFFVFFFGLIWYLRREDKREGYPLVSDQEGHAGTEGFPPLPRSKVFLLPHGGTYTAPGVAGPEPDVSATPSEAWPGAAIEPVGNPMRAGAGPGAYALRANVPELTFEDGLPRIVPLRVATDHWLDEEGTDPRGMDVVGADGVLGGKVSDCWIDLTEMLVRYLEVTLVAGPSVLVPMPLARIASDAGPVTVQSIMGAQFADVPMLANPDMITAREEDMIAAYYGGGTMYAAPNRVEPIL
jgi:photosynthetic reaction center H subunit